MLLVGLNGAAALAFYFTGEITQGGVFTCICFLIIVIDKLDEIIEALAKARGEGDGA